MNTAIKITILLIILIFISACSKGYSGNIPISKDIPQAEPWLNGETDINRTASGWGPYFQSLFAFSDEGLSNYQTQLVDCIATTSMVVDGSHQWNYVLICDTKGKWAANPGSYMRGRIHIMPVNTDEESDITEGVVFVGSYIVDPDACDLTALYNPTESKCFLHAFTFDGDDSEIRHYSWILNSSTGSISSINPEFTLECDNDYASGMCVVPTYSDEEIHVLVCDPVAKEIYGYRCYYDSGDWVWDDENFFVLDDVSPDTPVDICATRWDTGDPGRYWSLYVAVQDSLTRDEDYIWCYKWSHSNQNYTTYQDEAFQLGAGNVKFPCILAVDVQKVGTDAEAGEPYDAHLMGTVTALMWENTELRRLSVKQMDFYDNLYNTHQYYEYNVDFDWDYIPNGEIYVHGAFAVTRMDYTNNFGQYYLIGSRDPDLNYEDSDDGKNVHVYSVKEL